MQLSRWGFADVPEQRKQLLDLLRFMSFPPALLAEGTF